MQLVHLGNNKLVRIQKKSKLDVILNLNYISWVFLIKNVDKNAVPLKSSQQKEIIVIYQKNAQQKTLKVTLTMINQSFFFK